MSNMPSTPAVHPEQKLREGGYPAHLGSLSGTVWGVAAHPRQQAALWTTKRNHRTLLWNGKGVSWVALHELKRDGSNEDESRAYFCMHEFEETSDDDQKVGPSRPRITGYIRWKANSCNIKQSDHFFSEIGRFVYSLKPCLARFFLFLELKSTIFQL